MVSLVSANFFQEKQNKTRNDLQSSFDLLSASVVQNVIQNLFIED